MTRALALLACAALLAGCKHFDLQQRPAPVDRDEIRTTRGVTYKDLFRGQSACAGIGDEVLLDYTLFLQDGTRVDSTLDRGVPVRVVIGDAFVRGLDDGLFGICPGGRRRITVPPDLGYGEQGVPGLVPPHATLVFEVHAIEVHPGRK